MNYIIYLIITSFIFSIFIGYLLIPILRTLKLGQYVKDSVLKNHKSKSGTPTFGGLIFILACLITILINIKNIDAEFKLVIYSFVVFALIGFIDDTMKTIHKNNQGLSALQKIVLLLAASLYCTYYINNFLSIGTSILIPFRLNLINLNVFYIPFVILLYMSVTNAVNLTDGLDGLASSVTILVITFFTIISFCFGKYSLSAFCGILSGSLLGFLRYNTYPAKIIMGDTGSLALGGVIATIAILLKLPLILIFVGGIYLFETGTTLIQIIVFKLTGKRVFKITPIHHTFEQLGWHESKIVAVFSIATVILCLISFLSL